MGTGKELASVSAHSVSLAPVRRPISDQLLRPSPSGQRSLTLALTREPSTAGALLSELGQFAELWELWGG